MGVYQKRGCCREGRNSVQRKGVGTGGNPRGAPMSFCWGGGWPISETKTRILLQPAGLRDPEKRKNARQLHHYIHTQPEEMGLSVDEKLSKLVRSSTYSSMSALW